MFGRTSQATAYLLDVGTPDVGQVVCADSAQDWHAVKPSVLPLHPSPYLCRPAFDDMFDNSSQCGISETRTDHATPQTSLFLPVDHGASETPAGAVPPPSNLCRERTYDELDDRLLLDAGDSWPSDLAVPFYESCSSNDAVVVSQSASSILQQVMDTTLMPNSEVSPSIAPTAFSESPLFAPWWGFAVYYPNHEGNLGNIWSIDGSELPWSQPHGSSRQHFEIAAHLDDQWSAAETRTETVASNNWIECESLQTSRDGEAGPVSSANGRELLGAPAQALMQDRAVDQEADTTDSPATVEEECGAHITKRILASADAAAPPKTGFVMSWTVQAATSILFGGTNRIVSPWLETCFPAAPFKLTIHALAQTGGKRSFRDAEGQGTVEVKCDTVLSHPVSFLLSLSGDLAAEKSLGPFTHDFGNSSVWRLPDELAAWDLRRVAKETFSVCLEILPC